MTFTLSDLLAIISLIVGAVSIALSLIAMKTSKNAEKESRENFTKTQSMMNEIFEKTKETLHDIDKKSAVIEEVTQKHQMQLTQLFSNVLDKVVQSPLKYLDESNNDLNLSKSKNTVNSQQPVDGYILGQQLAMQLLPELIKNPDSLENLTSLSEKLKDINNHKT